MQGHATFEPAEAAAMRARRRESIQDWLLTKVAEALAVDAAAIDVRESLATYGLGSVAAVSLTGDLETWLRLEVSPTLVWEYPTIESLAARLDEMLAEAGQS